MPKKVRKFACRYPYMQVLWPKGQVKKHVKFDDGVLVTDDAALADHLATLHGVQEVPVKAEVPDEPPKAEKLGRK